MRLVQAVLAASVLTAVAAPAAAAFRWTDEARNVPTGVVGQSYSHALPTVGGCNGVQMVVESGSLPPGISLAGSPDVETGSNYRFQGTPTAAGEYTFWLKATSIVPECAIDSTEEPFTIRVVGGLAIETPGLPTGTVGSPYPGVKVTASGGGSQTFSAAGLPAGLAMAPDGTLSGTPTAHTGGTTVTVTVSDGAGRSASRSYELAIRNPLALAPLVLRPAEVGYALAPVAAAATGGNEAYSFALEGTPPAGVAFDPATRTLAGTPRQAGRFALRLRVTDTEGRTAVQTLTLTVAPRLAIATRRLAVLRAGRAATLRIRTTGGVPILRKGLAVLRWRLTAGRLPPGLRLNGLTGALVGTPRKAGVHRFAVSVTDRYGATARRTLTLTVR